MLTLPSLPSIPLVRAQLITRRLRLAGVAAASLHVMATGRTGSGKTTIGNRLLGTDYFLSSGRQDCTREINRVQFPGGLTYADLPGVCSDDRLENFNRVALGLEQVEDFPTVTELELAEYVEQQTPQRLVLNIDDFRHRYPTPDLLFYVFAADKQFTSADRRYLRDLLRKHQRVLYVLNVFANSPPTEGNVRDIVGNIVKLHQAQYPGTPPQVVALDGRTGDGLADLLQAARAVVTDDTGTFFADMIADQQRRTPAAYAYELEEYLLNRASDVAVLQGDAIGTEHMLHRLTGQLLDQVQTLRGRVVGQSCATRYRALISQITNLTGAPAPSFAQVVRGVLDFAQHVQVGVLRPARVAFDAVQGTMRKVLADIATAQQQTEQQLQNLASQSTTMLREWETQKAAYEQLKATHESHQADLAGRKQAIDMQRYTLEHEVDSLNDDLEQHEMRLDSYRDAVYTGNANGGFDEYNKRAMDREQSQINRNAERLNRQRASLQRQQAHFSDEVDTFNRDVDAGRRILAQLDAQATTYNELGDRLRQLIRSHSQAEHESEQQKRSDAWAEERFVQPYNQGIAHLEQRLEATNEQCRHATWRAQTLERQALASGFNSEAAHNELDELRQALANSAAQVIQTLGDLQLVATRFLCDREINALLRSVTVDHYDQAGVGDYRGSTYQPLGKSAAVFLLAASQIVMHNGNLPTEYPPLAQHLAALLPAATNGPLGPTLRELQADIFGPEFAPAVARLEAFAG